MLDKCIPCQAVGKPPSQEPLSMTLRSQRDHGKHYMWIFMVLPSGEYLLVAVNRYSRYPVVEIVRSTRAATVVPKLDQMFT